METTCGKLLYVQWHITEHCHNNCRHCYAKEKRLNEETTKSDFQAILADIMSVCKRWKRAAQITLIGGDPMIHPDFWEFVSLLNNTSNVRIIVAGNPETLTQEAIKRLQSKIFAFQVSVDGNESVHDWFRYPGSYQCTLAKIKEATALGLRMHCMTTVSEENVDQLVDIMLAVYQAGIHRWAFARYVPPVGQKLSLDPERFQKALVALEKAHKPFEESGHDPQRKDPLWVPFRNRPLEANPNHCQVDGCGIGSPTFGILPDNTLMACRRHEGSRLGVWQKSGDILNLLVSSPVIQQLRQVEKIKGCQDCPFLYHCRGCRAIGYAVKGDIFDPDPTCSILNRKEVISCA